MHMCGQLSCMTVFSASIRQYDEKGFVFFVNYGAIFSTLFSVICDKLSNLKLFERSTAIITHFYKCSFLSSSEKNRRRFDEVIAATLMTFCFIGTL